MKKKSVYFVSLGCAKNRVDTEVMLGLVMREGLSIAAQPEDAQVIIINTCGFIGDAKEESIDTILEMAEYRRTGRLELLVVTGCLAQRYAAELKRDLPEIDVLIGAGDLYEIGNVVSGRKDGIIVSPQPTFLYDHESPRVISTPAHTVYVKIAEGCDRPCGFCAIPQIRGRQRSRLPESIVEEVRSLVAGGAVELNLIAQDTTAYGADLAQTPANLPNLLAMLAELSGVNWLRVQYAYPTSVTDAFLDVMADRSPIVKYLDVPLQHVDDEVLRLMRRGHGERWARELVARARERVPGIVLRSTFLVGHPGETPAAFRRLRAFVEENALERVGVFAYSPEEGTYSATLDALQVPPELAQERLQELMELQRGISQRKLRAFIGHPLEVLVDGISDESPHLLVGRSQGQAPEVDGQVYLALPDPALGLPTPRAGDIVRAQVDDAAAHDLVATVIGIVKAAPSAARKNIHLPILGH